MANTPLSFTSAVNGAIDDKNRQAAILGNFIEITVPHP